MPEYKKKLIEVALPLEVINRESAREKAIRHGHPSTLHLWWARRPLVACRAVLFASLVDDPSAHVDQFPTEDDQERERQRLFRIIEDLVKWENSTNETVIAAARAEIMRSTDGNPPPVLDPFCGGGSIPLEAQRLGLEAYGSDLNPVAVLITKAMIELPPKFASLPPVNPDATAKLGNAGWSGAQGLANDVRYYGRWMRDAAVRHIGHLYPTVTLPSEHGGGEATVIAWLWARTVKCPNPACGVAMPLVRSFTLSSKKGRETFIEPIVDNGEIQFEIRRGTKAPEGTVGRNGAKCVRCDSTVPLAYIREEGQASRLGVQMMAIVASGNRRRIYLPPDAKHTSTAAAASPDGAPDTELPTRALGFRVQGYGMARHRDLLTDRQLASLVELASLVDGARGQLLEDGADGEYANAVATYLALGVSKVANRSNMIASWMSSVECPGHMFARQTVSMSWDYAEANVLTGPSGSFLSMIDNTAAGLEAIGGWTARMPGSVDQLDAKASVERQRFLVSTDPPYYDNVGFADLSDFFYIWLRQAAQSIYPSLFSTLLTPKDAEVIASPERFGGDRERAEKHFEKGLGEFFRSSQRHSNPAYPVTIYYAFKQAEGDSGAGAQGSTAWETMLAGLLEAGFAVTATWPVRTERAARSRARDSNALASSIVLACRPLAANSPIATRREFRAALRAGLPDALRRLQKGNIAPVDLAQAAIGPGMAVFSQYSRVVETDGSQMRVGTALGLINESLDEILAEQEGEFDADTRWAIAWFEQFGLKTGEFGAAETLCKAKNCSVQGLVEAGIVESRGGRARLLRRDELETDWDPTTDKRLTVWEMTQHLLRQLDDGEAAAAALARRLGSFAEVARDLAYRLYLVCERKKWSQDGQAYNALVVAWPEIQRLAAASPQVAGPSQTSFEV